MKKPRNIWRLWAKSLGEKASKCDKESDTVAVIRTIIFITYLITNCFIVYGVLRTHHFPTNINSVRCIDNK
jgi:hypothetical protein